MGRRGIRGSGYGGGKRRHGFPEAALKTLAPGQSPDGGRDENHIGSTVRNIDDDKLRRQPFGHTGNMPSKRGSRLPKIGIGTALVVVVVWTLIAWVGYGMVDGILAWATSNVGAIVQSGKDAAAATGIGKDVIGTIGGSQATGFLGGLIGLAGIVLRPLIVLVWMAGTVLILLGPWLVSLLRRVV